MPVAEEPQDPLRALIAEQAGALTDAARSSGGLVSSDGLDAAERLVRLAEIRAGTRVAKAHRRWPVAAILAGSLALASLLLFARVSETEIELEIDCTGVAFASATAQRLTEPTSFSALGVSGLRQIEIPASESGEAELWAGSEAGGLSVRFSPQTPGNKRPGSISLAPVPLSGTAHVRLRRAEGTRHYLLSVEAGDLELRMDVNGPVLIERSNGEPGERNFKSPQGVVLRPGSGELDLDLWFSERVASDFASQLEVHDVSFLTVDELLTGSVPVVRRVSTIIGGSLYFESLGGEERKIRSGESLQFQSSAGEIRRLRLHDDHIGVVFHGRVTGMTAGAGENRRSLMPSWLEWLRARHGLTLLWGSAIYLFGLVIGVLRWWKSSL